MDSTSIELPGSTISQVKVTDETVRIRFEPAVLIKTMTGSIERTKWQQKGELVFEGAELLGDEPSLPALCTGGDVSENVYTYRDMIPFPLNSRGQAGCSLTLENGSVISVQATAVHIEMEDTPKYIEHIRD